MKQLNVLMADRTASTGQAYHTWQGRASLMQKTTLMQSVRHTATNMWRVSSLDTYLIEPWKKRELTTGDDSLQAHRAISVADLHGKTVTTSHGSRGNHLELPSVSTNTRSLQAASVAYKSLINLVCIELWLKASGYMLSLATHRNMRVILSWVW